MLKALYTLVLDALFKCWNDAFGGLEWNNALSPEVIFGIELHTKQ